MRDSDWGVAMAEQKAFLELLRSERNKFHLIVMSHLKIIGPREVRHGDDDITTALKKQQSDLVPTRLYPSALGRMLPPEIPGMFDTVLLAECVVRAGRVQRLMRTIASEEMDVKVPTKNLPDKLPIETGLLDLFKALVPWSIPK